MACCVKCFLDEEIQGFINTMSNGMGTCNYCGSTNVALINPGELEDSMYYILNSYTNHPTAILSTNVDAPSLMHEHISFFWPRLFNSNVLSIAAIKQLLYDIGGSLSISSPTLFTDPVELRCFLDPATHGQASLQETKWIDFTDEIKNTNRFFLKRSIDLDLLAVLLEKYKKYYPIGMTFFRSRITGDKNIPVSKMGKPPSITSRAGRANPTGIPYLYLAHDKLTTVYEARTSLNDNLSIATFVSIDEIKVMPLTDILSISPLLFEDDLDLFMLYRKYMQRLSYELSKPIRRNESELDYLPTQYLCEYIKFCGFDAVEYQSSLNPIGINIALFDDSKVKCTKSKLYSVKSLIYNLNPSI